MNLKLLTAPILAATFAAPAFALTSVIDKTETTTEISVNDSQIQCWLTGTSITTYVPNVPVRARISIPLSEGELSWLPIMQHGDASLLIDAGECPSINEIAGKVVEGKTLVKVKRVLQTVELPTYSACPVKRLDEKIELTLSSGKVLTSRQSHSLSTDCQDNLK